MFGNWFRIPGFNGFMCLAAVLGCLMPVCASSAEPASPAGAEAGPSAKRCGFYLHTMFDYNYPLAVRSWKPEDYHKMFQLLKQLGYNTVMIWPFLESIPAPLSPADREDVEAFRPIIDDARRCGLETWLASCVVASNPETAQLPWLKRSLLAHMKTVRTDDPQEAESFLQHRAALWQILNNADGYVTIDGDPGGYPGAKPEEFLRVMQSDRETINRFGTHPAAQKIIPWIWCGWGSKPGWAEPIGPFVSATLELLKQQPPAEPWELLPGRSHEAGANKRINMELIQKAGLLDRSTLFFYEAIEYEPSVPSARLHLADIRDYMRKEQALLAGSRGCMGNAQSPVIVLPNIYFFARCAADPSYIDRTDEEALADFARLLGGPPELLVPAWSCLQLPLDRLPEDLPAKLRAATLSSPTASLLPGGAEAYLDILAAQVEVRIRLLRAVASSPKTPQEAATAIADGTAAAVDWWKKHRFPGDVGGSGGCESFQWRWTVEYPTLRTWCSSHVTDPQKVSALAVEEIVNRGVLEEPAAKDRIAELLTP